MLGSPYTPAAHVHPACTGWGEGPQPIPTWPHQLPWQPGSDPICAAPDRWLQECHSCGHKGPLCEWSRLAGGHGTASRAGAGRAAAEGKCVGSSCHQPCVASQLLARLSSVADAAREENPLPSSSSLVPSAERWEHPAPTSTGSCTNAVIWHLLGMPCHLCHGMPRAQPPHEGSERNGGMEWGQRAPAAAAEFGLFQQLPSQCQQQGMCLGQGVPGPVHGALSKLFIVLMSLPSRNGPYSSCAGPDTTGVPTNTPLGPCWKDEGKKGLLASSHLPPVPFCQLPV